MVRGAVTPRIPNPHHADVGRDLLSRILRQAGVDRDDWEKTGNEPAEAHRRSFADLNGSSSRSAAG
jgi:hypothetical protein